MASPGSGASTPTGILQNTQQPAAHRRWLGRAIFILGCAIILVPTGFVGYNFYTAHTSSVNFTEYEPRVLPPGVHMLDHSVDVWRDNNGLFTHHKILTINLSGDSHSHISEQKATDFSYTCDNGIAINQTCQIAETPHHQKYSILATYYNEPRPAGEVFEQSVTFTRGNTNISVLFEGSPAPQYSQATWDRVVDSFAPVHYSNITVHQYTPGP